MASVIYLSSGIKPEKYTQETDIYWAGRDESSYVRPIIAKGNIIQGIKAKE